jgi:hypothetical protein
VARRRGRVPLPLVLVLAVAVVLRVLATIWVWPATIVPYDPGVYVFGASDRLFNDLLHPAGYPLFLRMVHAVWGDLIAVTIVQHLLGLAGGVLVYLTGRRLGLGPWAAAIPAAMVLLAGGPLYLEHVLLTEGLFTFLLYLALYLAVRAVDADTSRRWVPPALAIAAGVALGLSGWTRTVSAFLVPAFALWVLWAAGGSWRRRLALGGATFGAGVAMLLVYALASSHYTGSFGLSQGSGWAAYARTAQFADCSKFREPAGTERLCETTPTADRHGPTFYHWNPESPAQKMFGYPPKGNEQLGQFGRRAILGQPFDYAGTVATDFARYAFPSVSERPDSGGDFRSLDVGYDNPRAQVQFAQQFGAYYPDLNDARVSAPADELADAANALNLRGVALVLLFVLAVAGVVVARGRARRGIVFTGGLAFLLFLIPVATLIYNARYGVPAYGPLGIAGVAGASALLGLRR